jgi:amino acid transporter
MFLAILLVFITLLVPILVATGASDAPYDQWTDGYFVQLGREIGGPWLAYWLMFASALSNIGMFEAEMSSDSWQVAGMADRGILPAVLGARSEYDTPVYGILLSAGGVLCLGWMSFGEVVAMLNLLYCYSQLIEFAAFLHLRVAHPELPRPFRIPIGTVGMCILLALPMAFIGVVVYFSSPLALGLSALLCAMGGGAYYLLQLAKERGWCDFEERHIHDHDDVLPQ